jgi:putative transposase
VGLEAAGGESTDAWESFLNGLVKRGLCDPLVVVSDGAPGLISAIEVVFSTAVRQRCLIHRARNILAKVPAHANDQVKRDFWAIFEDIEAPPGDAAVNQARCRAKAFATPGPSSTPQQSPASRTTKTPCSPTCACPRPIGRAPGTRI